MKIPTGSLHSSIHFVKESVKTVRPVDVMIKSPSFSHDLPQDLDLLAPFKETIYVNRPLFPRLDEYISELKTIWQSKWLTNFGPRHNELETTLKNYLGVPHIALFNNGTSALIAGIKALGLKGEVITTPYTFPAVVHSLKLNDIKPVFADIDPITLNIDPDKIEKLITPNTSAILAVHTFGIPANVEKIQEIAQKYHLKIVYDAAHAFGVEKRGIPIGCFGDMTMFSFHPTKPYSTVEGGALAFKDPQYKDLIKKISNFGLDHDNYSVIDGFNGKMNELQSVFGLLSFKFLGKERRLRQILDNTYRTHLKDIQGLTLPPQPKDITVYNYPYFIVRIHKEQFGMSRDELHQVLKRDYNIELRKYFSPLVSQAPMYKHLPSATKENLPVAHVIEKEVLALPIYPELKVEDAKKICYILKHLQEKAQSTGL